MKTKPLMISPFNPQWRAFAAGRLLLRVIACGLLLGAVGLIQAQTSYRLSTVTSGGSWATPGNWNPNTSTAGPGNSSGVWTDVAILPLGTLTGTWNMTLDSSPTIGGFSVTSAGAYGVTLNPGAPATSTFTLHGATPAFTNNVLAGQTLTIAAPFSLDTANTLFTNLGTGNLTISTPTNGFFTNLKSAGGLGSAANLTINNVYTNLPPLTQLKTGAGALTLALIGGATNTFFTNQNAGSLGGNGNLKISNVDLFSSAAGTAQMLTNNSTSSLELDLDNTSPSAFLGSSSFGGLGSVSGKTGAIHIRYINGTNTLASAVSINTGAAGSSLNLNLYGYGNVSPASAVVNGGTWNVPGNLALCGGITLNIDSNMGGFINSGTLLIGSANSGQFYVGGNNTVNWNTNSNAGMVLDNISINSQGGTTGIFNMNGGSLTNSGTFTLGSTSHSTDNSSSYLNVLGGTLGISSSGGIVMPSVITGGAQEYSYLTITNSGVLNLPAGASFKLGSRNVASDTAATTAQATVALGGGTLLLGTPVARQTVAATTGAGSAQVQFYFNGGTLQATTNLPQVFTGFGTANSSGDAVYVAAGGAVINNGGFNVGISNNLLESASSTGGGLTNLGSGTLTLSGANTYTGPTMVSAGKLVTTTTSSFSSSGFIVADGAANQIVVASPGTTLNESSLTLGTSTGAILEFNDAGFANPTAPIVTVNNPVVMNGTVTVNFFGTNFSTGTFCLMIYPAGETINSGSGFVLGSLPFGVGGYLTDNLNELDLTITNTYAYTSLNWNGNVGNVWDIDDNGNGNWYGQPGNISGANYIEDASLGLPVTFDDTAAGITSITLGVTVHPVGVTINNNNLNYSITGAGSIASSIGLTKNGSATFILGVANNFTNAVINGGTLGLTNTDNILPVTATVTFGGPATLDLGGNNQTLANLSFGSLTTGIATVGNGNLTITGDNWNPQPNAADTAVTTEDLSELTTLTYTNGSQLLFQGTLGANSTTRLAETNNFTVSALNIATGNLTAATATYTESVLLGQINVINTASIQLGGYHNCGSFLGFNPGLTSPTVTLRGQSGGVTPVASITIGENNNGTFPPSTCDTTVGSIDTIANNLTVVYNNSGAGAAKMSISNGTVNVGVCYMNEYFGTQTNANSAMFNQSGGTVLAGTLAYNTNATTGLPTFTSVYNLGNGASAGVLAAQAILIANNTKAPNTSSRATLNFTNGTIENYDPALGQPGSAGAAVGSYATAQNLTLSGLAGGGTTTADYRTLNIVLAPTGAHNIYAESGYLITEQSTALISGSGGLMANGAGTLVLSSANTYTGGTTVSGGTLEADNNKALGTGLLTLSGGALSNNASSTLTNYVNLSSAATVGVGASQTLVLGGVISNTGALTKAGSGTLMLTNGNTYTGNTAISAGTLALQGAASLASPLISVANGACFDVSGLSSPFVLGVSQTLSNNAAGTGILNSNLNTVSGTVAVSYIANIPAFIITNGTLTLSAGTVFNINNTGSAFNAGTYTVITNATTGSPGAVAGIAPTSVTVGGNGLALGATASLQITNGALVLVVVGSGPSLTIPTLTNSISIGSTNLTFSWAADHIGYRLLVQTNHLATGVSSNTNDWGTVAGSTTTNQVTVPINNILPTEFYRLVYP